VVRAETRGPREFTKFTVSYQVRSERSRFYWPTAV
jgi:hypothetical protein